MIEQHFALRMKLQIASKDPEASYGICLNPKGRAGRHRSEPGENPISEMDLRKQDEAVIFLAFQEIEEQTEKRQ
jgi:hypothetical protein